jgi:hypothetical protein
VPGSLAAAKPACFGQTLSPLLQSWQAPTTSFQYNRLALDSLAADKFFSITACS